MASLAQPTDTQPLILTIPGLDNSGPGHWQTRWEAELEDCLRVDLGNWDRPHRNSWVSRLDQAIAAAGRPVVLVAHSLGCHAVAWWAALAQHRSPNPVVAALLVAPPEVDSAPADNRIAGFGPTPKALLPFPTILVASRDDPYLGIGRARRLATFWGAEFADAGEVGHINADSDIGEWPFGQFLLTRLTRRVAAIDQRSPFLPASLPISGAAIDI